MCAPALLEKDLSNKVYIVTGANSGIGLGTVTQLAKQGATVVLCCRRVEAGQACAAQITGGKVEVMALDLADLDSVRSFVESFLAKHDRLDGLINNAGVMNTPLWRTKQGFEMQLGTNHLGHFALTAGLTPLLKKSAPSRVVVIASCAAETVE